MADEGTSLSHLPSPESPQDSSSRCQECVSPVTEDLLEGCGPSSVEVQLDLSDSSRSISLESRLDDFNDCNSPLNTVTSDVEQDLDIMGIANTWNDDDAFVSAAAPADNLDTSFLVLPRHSTDYGPRPSPPPLDMFGVDQEPDCEPISDVKDINSCAGVCGLRNLGNTCFMNSGLQCLVNTAPLVNYFFVHAVDDQSPENGGGSSLTFQFAALLRKMWSGHYSTLSPADFKQALASCHPQFRDYRQHDCQEFLALMLDTLHEQLKVLQLKPSSHRLNQTGREDRAADTAPDCCLHAVGGEAVELYESSRSSQLSSPRSSDSAETSSSCTASYSSVAATAAAALSIRSLPIPEDVGEFATDYGPACATPAVPRDALVFPAAEKTPSQQMIMHRNNLDPSLDNRMEGSPILEKNVLTEISSMIKDSKTANVNLMTASISDVPANNELHFDSNKFPRVEHLKSRPGHPISPTVLRNSLDKVDKSGPIKMTNFLREAAKRNSEQEDVPCAGSHAMHSSQEVISKKARLDNPVWRLIARSSTPPAGKSSVVTELFQGLFRSTVVCSSCNHVSVTNEPFVYLSLPLPHALERTLEVVVVPGTKNAAPYTISVLVNQYDKVAKLRQAVEGQLNWQPQSHEDLVLAEVTDHYVARLLLDDHLLIRSLRETQRSVYAFLVPNLPDLPPLENSERESKRSAEEAEGRPWKSCVICLDEMSDDDLFKHTSCPCLLCQSCIELSCRHQSGDGQSLLCPVCYVQVRHQDEFAPLAKIHEYKPVCRNLRVAIVFRVEQQQDGNPPTLRLTACPRMVQLPSLVQGSTVYQVVRDFVVENVEFRVHLVDSKGLRCSRCLYPSRCTGCLVTKDQQLSLQPGDYLAVEAAAREEDSSPTGGCFDVCPVPSQEAVGDRKIQRPDGLTLSDCLRAFSESEVLDEGNPWFCPSCQKNQCASKTLSIQQPPPFIIVYLKRFVFHENASIKLDNRVVFPVDGLDLAPYITSSVDSARAVYDLYAIVCHFGSASSGHYTCYSKHSSTGEWHYYNDETVLKRSPQEDDYRHAYILFYHRVSSPGAHNSTK